MGRPGAADGTPCFALLLLSLFLSSAPLHCSAAFNRKQQQQQPTKEYWSPPSSPRRPEPPSADVGRRSSVVLPLYGNVYPDGLYFVSLSIGDPPRPYFLDVDTGSDLTWVQCDAPCVSCSKGPHPLYRPTKEKLVPCEHPVCATVQAATGSPFLAAAPPGRCDFPGDQCDYEVEYADQGSSRGVLVSDAFAVRLLNGSVVRPRLAFGCGYDQQLHGAAAEASTSPTDGVLGLGVGASGVMAQLREQGLTRNVMGHCLGRKGGGFLFFGDELVPAAGVSWTPMSRRVPRKYYSPGPANLFFGRQLVGRDFEVIFDSGSSYTYFSSRPYETFLHMKHGNLCLGVLNGTEVGLKDLNIIGDISVQDLMVVYDNEREQIGWARANCDKLPNKW